MPASGRYTFAARDSRPKNGSTNIRNTTGSGELHPRRDQPEPRPVRFFPQVAVPDHQVLAEGQIAPERGEREAELSQIVEVILGDEVVARPGTGATPSSRVTSSARAPSQPPMKNHHAVHRALEVQSSDIERSHESTSRTEAERKAEEDGEASLQRMRRVNLAPLVAESASHALAQAARPLRARLLRSSPTSSRTDV